MNFRRPQAQCPEHMSATHPPGTFFLMGLAVFGTTTLMLAVFSIALSDSMLSIASAITLVPFLVCAAGLIWTVGRT